jgi:uncharacterized protein DUF5069
MEPTTAPDFTKGPPRSGRDLLGGYAWLARLADKARAEHAGTNGDYVAYCPFSLGFLERTKVSRDAFGELIRRGASDEELVTYFDAHVTPEQKKDANRFVLETMRSHLDEEDAEEGRTGQPVQA